MRGQLVSRTWQYDPALYAPPRYRRACAYEAFVPEPVADLSLTLDGELAATVSDTEARLVALNRFDRRELAPLARLLLRSESIASSRIEGMQVATVALARAEARSDAGLHVGSEAAEILANIDAMQLAIEEASAETPFGLDRILDVHRALLERSSQSRIAGEIRTTQNWIGGNDYNPCGAAFVPPPPEEVARLLDDLVAFCNEDRLPPLVQAAVAHAQFETIHPFADGNGRTGRALIHVILRRRGIATSYVPPISVILAASRDRYIRGLTDFREDRLDSWIELFATATARAAALANTYLERVAELQDSWRERLRAQGAPRSDAAVWALVEVLPAHPALTVAVGVAATRRSKPAIGQAIEQLVDVGVLTPISTGKRDRIWEARELLALIEELETGQP
jgi:Fic family protein